METEDQPSASTESVTVPDEEIVTESTNNEQRIANIQRRTLVILCLSSFCYGLNQSLYGPLLPRQAEEKGLTPTYFGAIIGCYYLSSLLFTPLIGVWVGSIANKYILSIGMFTVGTCSVLFGVLEMCPEGAPFKSLVFVIRILDGFGAASIRCSTFAISASRFPFKAWTTFINLEICYGLGMVIGPIAGGAVYDYSSIGIPFYGTGSLAVLLAILVLAILPEPDEISIKFGKEFWKIFKYSGNILYFFSVFSVSFYTGYLEPTLQPHIKQLTLNGLFTGLIFFIPDAVFSLTAYLWKWKIGKGGNNVMLIFVANLVLGISIILIAPASFTKLQISIPLVAGALFLKGLGQTSKNICSFHGAYSDSVYKGFSNDVTTQSYIFEMYILASTLGCFLGSFTSGFLFDGIGFIDGSFVPLGIELVMIPFVLMYAFNRNYRKPIPFHSPEEARPILS